MAYEAIYIAFDAALIAGDIVIVAWRAYIIACIMITWEVWGAGFTFQSLKVLDQILYSVLKEGII